MNGITEKRYNEWKSNQNLPEELKKDIENIEDNEDEILMRFQSCLSFGTAGLRGKMGAGTNYMNVYTVRQATQGLSEYVLSQNGKGVAIAYDTRNNSELFAKESACVLAANGIKAYIFDGPRPTPELSFSLRELGCIAGINITASHNPKEYNGYKAYWDDGAQLGLEQATAVADVISRCDIFEGAKRIDFEDGVNKGLIVILGKEMDEKYLSKVLEQRVNENYIKSQSDMAVVYTPLHGTGKYLIPEVLKRAGLNRVLTVPEQMIQDGNFPTVKLPNPEFPEAFVLSKAIAEKEGCELIIATDPDTDRMGLMIKNGDGYDILTGNQTGCLLLDYIISAYKESGKLPSDSYAVKSIVSTELASDICKANGVKMYDVLTGFKFIGEVIKKHEEMGYGTFLFGFEESYGCLKGTYARDKDAVVASLLAAEMAAYYRSKGLTLKNAIDGLYEKYGYYREEIKNISFGGADGQQKMANLTKGLRDNPPTEIGGEKIVSIRDYKTGVIRDVISGEETPTGLPSSDVLYYKTEHSVTVVRPSGTEPKVKVYFMAKGKNADEAKSVLEKCRASIEAIL